MAEQNYLVRYAHISDRDEDSYLAMLIETSTQRE